MRAALCRTFVHARALQDLRKDLSDLELDNVFRVLGVKFRVAL